MHDSCGRTRQEIPHLMHRCEFQCLGCFGTNDNPLLSRNHATRGLAVGRGCSLGLADTHRDGMCVRGEGMANRGCIGIPRSCHTVQVGATQHLGLFSPDSLWRTAVDSCYAFASVHPMTSPQWLGWMHVATYWFQIAAWKSKTIRGVLFWYFLHESVASFAV